MTAPDGLGDSIDGSLGSIERRTQGQMWHPNSLLPIRRQGPLPACPPTHLALGHHGAGQNAVVVQGLDGSLHAAASGDCRRGQR